LYAETRKWSIEKEIESENNRFMSPVFPDLFFAFEAVASDGMAAGGSGGTGARHASGAVLLAMAKIYRAAAHQKQLLFSAPARRPQPY